MWLRERDGALEIRVRALPRARKTLIEGVREDVLIVRLAAPPVDGAANDALLAVLAAALGTPRRNIQVTTGERSRNKVVMVSGVPAALARQRLERDPTGKG
jgi:uncharacterized protein (TIGR00251 family)